MNELSHRPEKPVTKKKIITQLDELRAYKSTHVTFCWKCDQFKPVRTHHCSTCEICVNRMDHHCNFLGVCIGKHNHRYFIQYLGWTFVTLVFMISHLLWIECFVGRKDSNQIRIGLMYTSIGLGGFLAFCIFCLWCYQCKRGCGNITMIEDMTGKVSNTFDTGSCCMNLREVYSGANCCSFWFPCGSFSSNEDGLTKSQIELSK